MSKTQNIDLRRNLFASTLIGRRIILCTILLSGFITLIVTLMQMTCEYQIEFNAVEERHNEIETIHVPLLASSLWNFNDDLIQHRLDGIAELPTISYLEIRSEGLVFKSGTPATDYKLYHRYPIYFQPAQMETEYLGEMYVESDTKTIYLDLIRYFISTLLINSFKTLIVCFVILWLVHRIINQRVLAISDYLNQFSLSEKSKPLNLPYRNSLMTRGDEIEELGTQVAQMAEKLSFVHYNLQQEHDRFAVFADISSDWLWESNEEGELTYASEPMKKSLGLVELPLEINRISALPQPETLLAHLKSIRPFTLKEEVIIADERRYLYIQATPKWSQGKFSGFRGTALDITEQVESQLHLAHLNHSLERKVLERTAKLNQSLQQLQRTQDQLIESEKLSALGRLVAGLSHEVNTPIGTSVTASSVMKGLIADLKEAYTQNNLTARQFNQFISNAEEASELLESNLERSSKLMKDFKQIAADQISEQCDNFHLHQRLSALISSLHSETQQLRFKPKLIGNPSLIMFSFPGVITQVFSHLIINSLAHAFGQQPHPSITIQYQLKDEAVTITYQDNGCGVAPDLHQKIFEPFYTSKRDEGASGLGLTTIYNLVTQKLTGEIRFDSQPGRGVTYTIILPQTISLSASQDSHSPTTQEHSQ